MVAWIRFQLGFCSEEFFTGSLVFRPFSNGNISKLHRFLIGRLFYAMLILIWIFLNMVFYVLQISTNALLFHESVLIFVKTFLDHSVVLVPRVTFSPRTTRHAQVSYSEGLRDISCVTLM